MGHEIAGFAGPLTTLLRFRERWRDCRLVDLSGRRELAFLPIPDWQSAEADELAGKSVPDDFGLESDFPRSRIDMLAPYSQGAAMAWVRTDYFGGAGSQAAILWVDGAHVFGPDILWAKDESGRPSSQWPINRALRTLGIARDGTSDEFAIFGLGCYRRYEDIVSEAAEFAR